MTRWAAAAACCALAWLLLSAGPAVRVVELEPGTVEISQPLVVEGSNVEVRGRGTVLRAAADFEGRALIECRGARNVRLHDFTIDGNRAALERPAELPPYDVPFARFTSNNGILVEDSRGVIVERVQFREIAGFAVLASRAEGVRVEGARVENSGSRNARGRNNTTGGILFEEGTAHFGVVDSRFENVRGNAVWTHSLYTSPRSRHGLIARNRFVRIGRDAVQVGHATAVRVEDNEGTEIGYPAEDVDVEGGGVPVAIDTAGNVDHCVYAGNRFTVVNGKCIDLDGFHHGDVRGNFCAGIANFAIVMNNSNPDMRPEGVNIVDNYVRGARFGGVFVIGSGNRVARNRLLELNTAKCTVCIYAAGEPDMLRSGIYLGRGAERPAPARGNIVEDNLIMGFNMQMRCVAAAPGIAGDANVIRGNTCADEN